MMGIVAELCDDMCFMNKYSINSQFIKSDTIEIDVAWNELPLKCAEELGYMVIAFNSNSFVLSTKTQECFFIVLDDGNYELFKLRNKEEAIKRFNRFSTL